MVIWECFGSERLELPQNETGDVSLSACCGQPADATCIVRWPVAGGVRTKLVRWVIPRPADTAVLGCAPVPSAPQFR